MFSRDQQQAIEKFKHFVNDPDATAFLLEGGPGTGKTFLTAHLLKEFRGTKDILACAPTHKAANVMRKFLQAEGFQVEYKWDRDWHNYDAIVTGTTAQAIGIAPVIVDDQNDKELKFKKAGKGWMEQMLPDVILIDEASMLPKHHFMALYNWARERGVKLLLIGDRGQLPPVKAQPINFNTFNHQAVLTQVMRNEGDIVRLAYHIRDGGDVDDFTPAQVSNILRVEDAADAYINRLDARPVMGEEVNRDVFIAYRNATVNTVQDRACQKIYGHGARDFRPGEVVVAESNIWRMRDLVISNQQEIEIVAYHDEDRNEYGVPVMVKTDRGNIVGGLVHVTKQTLDNPNSAYNEELDRRLQLAKDLQKQFKGGDRSVDQDRRDAWRSFFFWKDQYALSFRHPFAMTSHKSQGSTMRRVFVAAEELERFNKASLYVAVTRPTDQVVL